MAFDQTPIPKDLRPLHIARIMPEEPRIVAAIASATSTSVTTTATAGRKHEFFASPEGSIPVIYPASVSDAGLVGSGYGNTFSGVASWVPHLPVPVSAGSVNVGANSSGVPLGYNPTSGNRIVGNAVDHAGNDMVLGFGSSPNPGNQVNVNGINEAVNMGLGYNPNLGSHGNGGGADHGSEDGGDDSVSGKKVKFLCSFGGKILPRPSDGMLRYAGGQTRIISVRRDVNINELQRKMMDTYQQTAAIKYQLPDEDLDALVSVSCADDLDNMMEEYEKLLERSSDGSAKLRVFLFSESQFDASGSVQFGDLHDSGQRYFDAVNGVVDGGRITRKESMTSVSSTQNSDFSGTEAVESSGPGQGDVTWPPSTSLLSPGDYLAASHDSNPKLIFADTNTLAYAGVSAVPLGIPMAKSGPPQTSCSQPEVEFERSVPTTAQLQHRVLDFQQVGPGILPQAPQLRAYVDSRQENMNQADYRHLPPHMGFPNNHLLATSGPVFTQQHYNKSNADTSSLQYAPAMHMSMTPSGSHMAISPTAVQPLIQPQQTRLEQYPEENAFRKRIVQVPVDSSYNAYQAQHPPAIVGGYSWTQVPQPEPVVYSDGSVSHQQVTMEDCFMCQKTLPHAHSDPLVPGPRESGMSYSNSLHHSLRLENTMKAPPMNRVMITGTLGECIMEQGAGAQPAVHSHIRTPQSEAVVSSQNLEAPHENERTFLKNDNSGQPKISDPYGMIGLPGDVQSPYGMFMGRIPESRIEDCIQQHSVSLQPQALLSKPANSDVSHAFAVPIQASEHLVQEYSGKLPGVVSQEDAVAVDSYISCDQLRPVDGMMEALYICPPEINVNNDQSPVDKFKKEEILDHKTQQTTGREVLLDNILNKPQLVLESNHSKQFEMLPTSTEVLYLHNSRPMELHEVAQPPILGNKASHLQPKIGVPAFDSAEVIYGIPAFSGVELAYVNDRIPPLVEHKNDSQLQSKVVPSDMEALSLTGNMRSSLSPSSGVGNAQDSSNSLFSIQDPWKSRHDNHFPPPRPNKFATKKEAFTTRDPFVENHSGEVDLITGVLLEDGVSKPPSNSNKDSERDQSSQGSTEDLIRQELKAVAECVAASVFKPATSNPEQKVSERNESAHEQNQEKEDSNESVEIQHKAKLEDLKNKLPEKVNSGFPVSEGLGHLQIIKNSDLEELQELGSGTFGTVYHGKWRGTDVAIKRINDRCFAGKPSEQERMKDDFWNEAIKLADLHHPNVVAFYGVVLDGLGGSVATVTEFMVNGSLRNALQKNARNLDKRKRLLIAMDVAFGMGYLHGKNVVHFDLKTDNLLVNLRDPHRPICKDGLGVNMALRSLHVGDLGLSKVKCQTLISGGVRGTLPWMAPELLNGSSSLVSDKVDVFSFGIVLWELLTGEEPYADLHYGAIIGGIVSNTLRPPVPETCDPDWRSLMESCWSAEPTDRPNFTEIANGLRAMAAKIPPRGRNPWQPPQVQK
ncbi:hypothetical protein SADUNF_Sadunf18G0093000 [Salix dunnii]|uniref:Protein kinase domain-containing protein n=1 Tax=Salix dunnii TaxID=1413687 RepID=A0A835ME34_9ROSI|nr:hypothetical protein SADUNF_Sadunf18G0093000 [Salix dunnii]